MLLIAAAAGAPNAAFNPIARQEEEELAPEGWRYGLPDVHLAWALVVAALIPLARWLASVKRRRRDWWLRFV